MKWPWISRQKYDEVVTQRDYAVDMYEEENKENCALKLAIDELFKPMIKKYMAMGIFKMDDRTTEKYSVWLEVLASTVLRESLAKEQEEALMAFTDSIGRQLAMKAFKFFHGLSHPPEHKQER